MNWQVIELVCIDVDGTLVGKSGVVSDAVWQATARAREAGIRLAVCSGRPGFGVTRDLAAALDADGWHCFQNGASTVNLATRQSLSTALPSDGVALLVERARTLGRILELYTDDGYATENDEERARRHAGLLGVPFVPRPFSALGAPVIRAQFLLPLETGEQVLAEPYPAMEVSPSLAPTMPDTLFVGLTALGVNKGLAVGAIAEAYGVPLARVMYVGDGFNDVSAMRRVGVPVAMGDAEAEAVAVATHVVGTVEEDGLVEALEMAMSGEHRTKTEN